MANADWTVLVADDEPAARRGVRQMLAEFPEFAVVGECRDGTEVLAALDTLRPHVLFLEIQMPGIDGFEVIRRRTPERMPALIFLTAYDQFALRAFEAQALDYLLKPVTQARFATTIARLKRQLGASQPSIREPTLLVPSAGGSVVLAAREIDWIQSEDNYTRVWARGSSYLMRESMHALEQRVGDGFVRAHRRALVRLEAVRALAGTPDGELRAELRSGATVPIARRRRTTFIAALRERS